MDEEQDEIIVLALPMRVGEPATGEACFSDLCETSQKRSLQVKKEAHLLTPCMVSRPDGIQVHERVWRAATEERGSTLNWRESAGCQLLPMRRISSAPRKHVRCCPCYDIWKEPTSDLFCDIRLVAISSEPWQEMLDDEDVRHSNGYRRVSTALCTGREDVQNQGSNKKMK